jgi:hypothetical protein
LRRCARLLCDRGIKPHRHEASDRESRSRRVLRRHNVSVCAVEGGWVVHGGAAAERCDVVAVRRYLPTGNVRLSSSLPAPDVQRGAEAALTRLGLRGVDVVVVPWADLAALVTSTPFADVIAGASADADTDAVADTDTERPLAMFVKTPALLSTLPAGAAGSVTFGSMRVVRVVPAASLGMCAGAVLGIVQRGMTAKVKAPKSLGPVTVRFWNVLEDWVKAHSM